MTPEDKKYCETVQKACKSEGIALLLEDFKRNLTASDTVKVMPIIDPVTKQVISPASDEMFKRLGYVQALEWAIYMIEHYRDWVEPEEDDADL